MNNNKQQQQQQTQQHAHSPKFATKSEANPQVLQDRGKVGVDLAYVLYITTH